MEEKLEFAAEKKVVEKAASHQITKKERKKNKSM